MLPKRGEVRRLSGFLFAVFIFLSPLPAREGFLSDALALEDQLSYYGETLSEYLQSDREIRSAHRTRTVPISLSEFREEHPSLTVLLNRILNSAHVTEPGKADRFLDHCPLGQEGFCYEQNILKYSQARQVLLSKLHLFHDQIRGYYLQDVYCGQILTQSDFPPGQGPGPHSLPPAQIINVEHTWPQKLFNHRARYPIPMQRGDLHHLFPSLTQINSLRGHLPYGETLTTSARTLCPGTTLGPSVSSSRTTSFAPPLHHKGNVARAMFYFSIKYELLISQEEERILRTWHVDDPVDDFERSRHEQIFKIQRTRNPFIDYPELVSRIQDF